MTRRPHYYTNQALVDRTNRYIADIEVRANAEIDRLRLAQVAHDQRVLEHWEAQVEILNNELMERDRQIARLQKEIERLRRIKKKVRVTPD
jgi:predicted RNase H-like nuclease (RuvC/YqgF family)